MRINNSTTMIISLNIRVHGRVQGVGFRYNTRKAAEKFGISGYVKNEPEGTVFIEAEGEEEAIDQFVIWCHKGPMWARVDRVEVQTVPEMKSVGFVVK